MAVALGQTWQMINNLHWIDHYDILQCHNQEIYQCIRKKGHSYLVLQVAHVADSETLIKSIYLDMLTFTQ